MPSSIQISLHSIPSAPTTPTSFASFESTCAPASPLPVGWGPKVLNGRLVKSKHRQPTQSTSSRTLPPSALGSPSPLAEGKKDQRAYRDDDDYDDDNHDNDNDNENVHVSGNDHVNATKEPQKLSKHSKDSRDKEVKPEKPASGNKIWKLMKRISTGGLRGKYALHSPSFSMSGPSGKAPPASGVAGAASGGPPRSLSRAAQLRVTKLSNYSEESLSLSHQSHGSYGSLVASSSHTSHVSHGESCAGPALIASASAFNTFNHDHEPPPPVPAIPKDLQNHHHLQNPNVLLPPSVASSPSSPASLSSSEPGSNMSRKHHRRDRDSRSASSPIPSIPSPLSPGQFSSASRSSTNSSSSPPPPPHTPSPSPSAPSKKRILSRISSMGLLRRKPSIASGLAASLGFGAPATGTTGTLDKADKAEKSGKNEKMKNNEGTNTEAAAAQGEFAVQEVPALFTIPSIPLIPSTPPDYPSTTASKVSKPKSTKYSISCIPISSIPSMPSMSIIASSTPSTPIKSTTTTTQISSISFSSSSRPGTGKTTLSQSSSTASSPRISLDSRSRSRSMGILAMQSGSQSMSRSRSRSNSLDSLDSLGRRRNHHNHHDHNDHAHTTPTKNNSSNHHQDNHRNNNHNHNTAPHPTTTTDIMITNNNNNDYPYPLDKHIVPPLELSATLSGEDDNNKWGVEHVLSRDEDQGYAGATTSSSSVSLPAIGHINEHNGPGGNGSPSYPSHPPYLGRRDGVSVDPGLGPKRVNRSINNRSTGSLLLKDKLEDSNVMVEKVNKREVMVDKWERLLERVEKWDKSELDKLDGLKSRSIGGGGEPWTVVRSPEQEQLPSLPVPPRKRTKEKESRREKEKESFREEKWERSASMDIPASPVSSSPIYRERAIVDDTPAPSTFGRVTGKQIGAEGSMEEERQSSPPPIQGRASFSAVGDDGRDSRKKNGRDGSRKRRSLSAVRSASALISSSSSKDGQSNMVLPSPRSWTKSLSSPTRRTSSENAADIVAVVSATTSPVPAPAAAATPPRVLGTLFRKLSFSSVSSSPANGTEKRRNKSLRRPSTASSVSSAKARSVSISGKSGFFWNGGNGDNNKQGELESSSPSPLLPQSRRLLRKNSLLKGRSNTGDKDAMQDKPFTNPVATRMRRPRTADSLPSTSNNNGTLTEKEKRERWEYLLERSEKAGGTIHLHANGEGLLSDRMRMSMVSTASGVSGAQVGVQEGDY